MSINKKKIISNNSEILPDGESILKELSIDLSTIKLRSKRRQYRAAINWLTLRYKPPLNASNLDNIKGLLEAFYHLYQIPDWQRAKKIIFTDSHSSSGLQLHEQLSIWGYNQQMREIWQTALGKIDKLTDIIAYRRLGIAYRRDNDMNKALEFFQHSLKLASEESQYIRQTLALLSIGTIYQRWNQYHQAMQYYQQGLDILSQNNIDDPKSQAEIFAHMARIYRNWGQYSQAIYFGQESWKIIASKEYGSFKAFMNPLGDLGPVYTRLGKYDQAICCLKKGLEVAKQGDSKYTAGWCHRDLAIVFLEINDNFQAYIHLKEALTIFKDRNDNAGLAEIHLTWATFYYKQQQYDRVIKKSKQSLKFIKGFNCLSVEAKCYYHLGKTYLKIRQLSGSYYCLNKALHIFHQQEQIYDEMKVLVSLAELYQQTNDSSLAIENCYKAFNIAKQLQIPWIEKCQKLISRIEK